MKRTISLLSVLAFVLAFSSNSFAQITATAEVLQEITYDNNGTEINFGTLQSNFTSATIDPAASSGDAGVNNATAARITVTGATSETVLVTDPGTIALTHGGTSPDELNLDTEVTGETGNVTDDRGGSALTGGNQLNLDGTGTGTLWIGGSLTPNDDGDGTLDTGIYETTFTLTLNYL